MLPLYAGFTLLILFFLALDLGVFNRKAHVISTKEALRWTVLWVSTSLVFTVVVYLIYQNGWFNIQSPLYDGIGDGRRAAIDYLTGYILEYSLSLDNVFVIALIFGYFNVPEISQHRTLFWGILGALIFRGLMIAVGATLIHRFEWIMYVFGALLLFSAYKMMKSGSEKLDPEHNPLVRLARKHFPVTSYYEGSRFFTHLEDGRRAMTPLFLVLLVIETTDVMFAVDSIPAIFSITKDPFIVFTSNVFAILGLRSLYFVLAGAIRRFHHIKTALIFILVYIGLKMMLFQTPFKPSTEMSLFVIVALLTTGVVASVVRPPKPEEPPVELVHEGHHEATVLGSDPGAGAEHPASAGPPTEDKG